MIEESVKQFSTIDILVNNAGIARRALIENTHENDWEDVIAVNLNSNFYTIASTLPLMKKQRWGRIINLSSIAGLVGLRMSAAYPASKHGVIGLTKAVAL